MIIISYVVPTLNSGNKIQILPLNYTPTTCLNLSTAADVYSVVRHIVRPESSSVDVLGTLSTSLRISTNQPTEKLLPTD